MRSTSSAVEPRPDPAGISQYLTYGYVPGACSAFQGVRRLPPAHYLLCRDGRVEAIVEQKELGRRAGAAAERTSPAAIASASAP